MDLLFKSVVLCFRFGVLLALGNKGRHFIVTVPPLFHIDRDTECSLYIASNDDGQALVRTYIGSSTTTVGNYSLTTGVLRVHVSGMTQILSGIHTKAIEIITNIDVAVYVGLHHSSAESFTAFPISALSTSYGILSYNPNPSRYNYVQITSIENDTTVLVENFGQNTQNTTLRYMETLTIRTKIDSTGANISSTKPVNVITGCMCSNVPQHISFCDPIYDSPLPMNVWGNRFIIPPMLPRTGFVVRILAETKQTSINLTYSTGTTQRSVQFEGMYEIQLGTNTTTITTDKKVSIAQYAVGQNFDGTDGDPFMTTVPSLTHFSNDYIFPSLFEKWKNFTIRIAITVESQYLSELKLDDRNIASLGDIRNLSVPGPFSHYSVVVINLPSGSHTLKHPSSTVKFSALYYGFAHHYGHGLYLGYSYEVDDCMSSPCLNGATCVDGSNSYTCSCVTGYSGNNCETEINECNSSPCTNGASCTDGGNGYTCSCMAGYEGQNCETEIDECKSSPCQNGATCVDGTNDYTCSCMPGYVLKNCDADVDECESSPCLNGATCKDGIYSYTCSCLIGYGGENCETEVDDCMSSPCLNGATCVHGTNSYTCSCVTGYSGNNCETEINECNSSPCTNGATCTDGGNGYTCSCMAGYEGQNCETEIDECKPSPCQNGATCVDCTNDYTCSCMPGYGGKNCDADVDECRSSPCLNGATCKDGIYSYTCSCLTGYGGENCETEIDECVSSPCQNGATCSDNINGYKCICLAGYDGVNCAKIEDECLLSPCKNSATCIGKVNGYECTCLPGYSGTNCETESTKQQGEKISMYIVIGGVALGVIIIALGVYALYLKIAHKRRLQEILQPIQMEKNTATAEVEAQHTPENGLSAMQDVDTDNEYFSKLDESGAVENVYETMQ